jgi:fumarate hydratase class II
VTKTLRKKLQLLEALISTSRTYLNNARSFGTDEEVGFYEHQLNAHLRSWREVKDKIILEEMNLR